MAEFDLYLLWNESSQERLDPHFPFGGFCRILLLQPLLVSCIVDYPNKCFIGVVRER